MPHSHVLVLGLAAIAAADVFASHAACSYFRLENTSNNVVSGASFYASGTRVNISSLLQSIDVDNLPSFCRLELTITTNNTANTTANTEIWLPDTWNGRFLTIGNGGYSGGVAVADLGYIAIAQGFVGMSTDTGHTSTSLDATWAGPGNDNAIIDFAWRALHLSVLAGKNVIEQYYDKPLGKSYFIGCSTGGRQGLKEVQDFPEDFDGVVVGSPANWQAHLAPWIIQLTLNVQPVDSPHWISEATWADVIHPEVLKQCDHLDGVQDGLISNPRICNFRPETLACLPGQNPLSCLSLEQIGTLHKIYSNYYDSNQTYIFGGLYTGGEAGFPQYFLAPSPIPSAEEYYQYFVLNDTTWTSKQFNFDSIRLSDRVNPGNADATSPNLVKFATHQGKVIQYVGWGENFISAGNSLHYYETVHAFMRSHSTINIDDFYRLFTVPGMEHCMSGFGPNAFGGAGQAAAGMPPLSFGPEHNILASMVRWVEDGIGPETIIGTYYNNNTVEDGIGFMRPLCKYPQDSFYMGGNPTYAASFVCI